jgi:hypothetical protein
VCGAAAREPAAVAAAVLYSSDWVVLCMCCCCPTVKLSKTRCKDLAVVVPMACHGVDQLSFKGSRRRETSRVTLVSSCQHKLPYTETISHYNIHTGITTAVAPVMCESQPG